MAAADVCEIGFTVVDLGAAGPGRKIQWIPPVGVVLTERGKLGGRAEAGEPLLWVHARTQETLDAGVARLAGAYGFSDEPVAGRRWCTG